MSNNNGKSHVGPPFMVMHPTMQGVFPRSLILERLQASREIAAESDLSVGPVMDELIDDFREWSRIVEPGMPAHYREIGLIVCRVSSFVPLHDRISSDLAKSQGVMKAIEERINARPPAEPEGPRIVTE